MLWFQGEITEAINLSKAQKSLFIVLVEAENVCEQEETVWNDASINEISESNKCVCLKLKANSQLASQFSQIYPVIIYPTIYFIGNDGQPLEIKVGKTSAEELTQCFNKALELHKDQQPTEKSIKQEVDAPPTTAEAAEAPTTDVDETTQGSSNDQQNPSLEERTELAKQWTVELNAKKAVENIEDDKKKELERRKLGQEVNKLKEFQEDMERKELEKELKKKKEDDLRAREKIRREIEMDREERAKKFYKEKDDQQKLAEEKKAAQEIAENEKANFANAAKMEHARVQFRLPDGSSINHTFSSSDLFACAHSFILQHLKEKHSGSTDVSLSTTHPRKVYESDDFSKTFMELELVPSTIIIVLPRKSTVAESKSGENILYYIFAQLMLLYQYLVTLIFPSQTTTHASGDVDISSNEPTSPNYGGARPKVFDGEGQGLRQRKEGNIHRLTANDEDDEQATWNGNSTQQM